MCPFKYYDILKDSVNPFNTRLRMVQFAFEYGISASAIKHSTTRDTVRKWKKRYEEHGTKGLHNRSRAPNHIPHKTPKHIEEKVLFHRNRLKSWGPERLKNDFNIPISTTAIYRILKQNGKIKKYRRKYQRKQDLSKIKMRMKAFQKIQIDVKDLNDIPNYWEFKYRFKLPRYQYTARDVKSGLLMVDHAERNDCVHAANFLCHVAEHLKKYGVDLSKVIVQTDNGSEFVGNWRQRKASLFTRLAEKSFHMKHVRIPPGRCTFNSDVETSHMRIEKEFYDIEDFYGRDYLKIKTFSYLLYFNYARKNRNKQRRSPYQILKEEKPNIDKLICAFNPVILDEQGFYYTKYLPNRTCGKTVDYVPSSTKF